MIGDPEEFARYVKAGADETLKKLKDPSMASLARKLRVDDRKLDKWLRGFGFPNDRPRPRFARILGLNHEVLMEKLVRSKEARKAEIDARRPEKSRITAQGNHGEWGIHPFAGSSGRTVGSRRAAV